VPFDVEGFVTGFSAHGVDSLRVTGEMRPLASL
jgi:hypothetical protein